MIISFINSPGLGLTALGPITARDGLPNEPPSPWRPSQAPTRTFRPRGGHPGHDLVTSITVSPGRASLTSFEADPLTLTFTLTLTPTLLLCVQATRGGWADPSLVARLDPGEIGRYHTQRTAGFKPLESKQHARGRHGPRRDRLHPFVVDARQSGRRGGLPGLTRIPCQGSRGTPRGEAWLPEPTCGGSDDEKT